MKLNAPTKVAWIIAIVLAVLALVLRFVPAVPADCALGSAMLSAVLMIVASAVSKV